MTHFFESYFSFREKSKNYYSEFTERAVNLYGPTQKVQSEDDNASRPFRNFSFSQALRYFAYLFISLVPLASLLRSIKKDKLIGMVTVIASNRLDIYDPQSTKELISNYTKSFCGKEFLKDSISRPEYLLVIDPALTSLSIQKSINLIKQKVIVINIFVILWFFLFNMLKAAFTFDSNTISSFRQLYREIRGKRKFDVITAIKLSIISHTIRQIFIHFDDFKTCLFTSNSLLTEAVRAISIEQKNCLKVMEIQHGVLTNDMVDYFRDLKRIYPDNIDKISLIPQIGGLSHPKELRSYFNNQNDLIINTFFQKKIQTIKAEGSSILNYLNNETQNVLGKTENISDVIYIHYGGVGHDQFYHQSDFYHFEKKLIKLSIDEFNTRGLSVKVIYKYHPAHKPESFISDEFFKANEIILSSDLLWCLFVGDYSSTNLSTTMFESAFFQSRSLTPLILEDNFFAQEYLDKLFYPKENGLLPLQETISKWVLDKDHHEHQSLNEKFCRRLDSISIN